MNTSDFLFELGTEELPPRTLLGLSMALEQGVLKGMDDAGIMHGSTQRFATPRRLALKIEACAQSALDRRVERRGPPLSQAFDAEGAATRAAVAFAESCGVDLAALDRMTTDRGAWLAYRATEPGVPTTTLLEAIIARAVAGLPIARRMRWGSRSSEFVRPVRTLVVLFGEHVVPMELLGLRSDRMTLGHRFHAPRPIAVKSPQTYERQLRNAKVIADFRERRDVIRSGVRDAAAATGGTALLEEALLDEVTALVEWPVPLAARFEQRFLALPREVVIATVQDHQRYFPVQDSVGELTGSFVTVSNIQSRDPATVRAGNERVVRPRLSDAVFFWEQDRSITLDAHAAKLGGVTFQSKLGSYADKTVRIRNLALMIGERISADGTAIARAADLAKADLVTAMVGEFPELQGTMGRYYAEAQGEATDVAVALEQHYRPRFAGDELPSTKTGQALALADKLDTLVGIFAIGEKPTGTKDPFGLRRAALGILRIQLEGKLDLDLFDLVQVAASIQPAQRAGVVDDVSDFLAERLRSVLLERADGTTTEMIDAVLAGGLKSPVDVELRLHALKKFLLLPDSGVLTALNKRIVNILRKAPAQPGLAVAPAALSEPAEIRLHQVLTELRSTVEAATTRRAYDEALLTSTELRTAVDEFFEQVMVMDENRERRHNRLALLRDVRGVLGGVADLSRLPG